MSDDVAEQKRLEHVYTRIDNAAARDLLLAGYEVQVWSDATQIRGWADAVATPYGVDFKDADPQRMGRRELELDFQIPRRWRLKPRAE